MCIVICQRRADELLLICRLIIIDLRDTDKSRYFAMTEFSNCFIIRSPSLFSYFNHDPGSSGKRSAIFLSRAWYQLRMSRILFAAKHV